MLKYIKYNYIYKKNVKKNIKTFFKQNKMFFFDSIFCTVFKINSKIMFSFWKKTLIFLIKKSFFFFQKKGKIKTLNKKIREYLINKSFLKLLINFWNKIYFYFNYFEIVKMSNNINILYIKPLHKTKVYRKALMFWILMEFFKQNNFKPQKKKRKSLFYTFNLFFTDQEKKIKKQNIIENKNVLINFLK